ncbi:MAG: helix-turn-helix transcriptional regulator [Lachnospiraceae bacterium]|nr:helix-turn-helix transcriptional regulator [Lachnospiraceae bacterium]
MILADKIIMLRKKNGWSQEELAEKLNVTRQSVSKWEGAQSVPDLDKILLLGQIFGVSTDYLLKDTIEEEEYTEEPETGTLRRVSMEEANEFLSVKWETAKGVATGTFLCILSPICLLALGACAEEGYGGVTENMAAGAGLIVLLLMVAAACAIFLFCGFKTKPYEYLETEEIEMEYGVSGMVKERKKQFKDTYARFNVLGTCLCIFSAIPLMVGVMLEGKGDILSVWMVCLTLVIVGIGVIFFIRAGIPWASMQKLLQEGDYTRDAKRKNRKFAPVSAIYWLLATAGYLAWSFATKDWDRTWILWPVAGVLFAAVRVVCDWILKSREKN